MTTQERPDDDVKALQALPPVEPPAHLRDAVRRRAHADLQVAAAGGWLAVATRAWTRVGLPAALAVTVVGYLSWAVTSASALYR
jgi:hypothetical protein